MVWSKNAVDIHRLDRRFLRSVGSSDGYHTQMLVLDFIVYDVIVGIVTMLLSSDWPNVCPPNIGLKQCWIDKPLGKHWK